ncbi:MAG: PAS domain-containing protein [Clostridiales bacterium]|nr:PAS domain-containing protein [Clostridiales bacterium]
MADHNELIRQSIMRDMSEGVLVIGLDGRIGYVNPAAAQILDRDAETLTGQKFMRCFYGLAENDAFNQTILDAVYDASTAHRSIVPYFTGRETRQLHVTTSYLRGGEEKVGVIAVLSDISELTELRDAVKAMARIRALNEQLSLRNQLLSETFGRFLSDEIVRQLLETPDGLALGGKKRVLTILMSDLRGFTAMSERMEAQKLISMLNHYLGEMTEMIQRRNGTIIEFIGDGIMAIFGAPAPSDCHASDAVAAAIEMQARMEDINHWNESRGFPVLEMGIGINTGEVIVGNIGSEKRTKYGVVGSHVNLCGRIESYTVGGQVLISPETRAAVAEPLVIAMEQEVFPKGVKEPLRLSHVTGIGGRYNLSCKQCGEDPQPLAAPCAVEFYIIRDKHCTLLPSTGRLTALCRTGAVLETGAALAPYDNLELEAGGKLFAKVLSRNETGWLLRFTAAPPGFPAWYDEVTRR